MSDMKTVKLERASGPGFEAVQMMPLDTSRAQTAVISSGSPSADFVIPDDVMAVEITILALTESSDVVSVFHTDNPDALAETHSWPLGLCAGEKTLTYSLGESRELKIFMVPPTSGSALVAILGV